MKEPDRGVVEGALRGCIAAHGPITPEWLGSASKRVTTALRNQERQCTEDGQIEAIVTGLHGAGWETFHLSRGAPEMKWYASFARGQPHPASCYAYGRSALEAVKAAAHQTKAGGPQP